ncbi:MAG: Uma2 family endonuclease, partial [Isosphaeraceae bacterium]
MSTISKPAPTRHPVELVPELENGDRLTREEFERRYEAMPNLKKAELIEGAVYMPSPVRQRRHSRPHLHLCTWLGHYEAGTPGVEGGDNGSIRLDLDNEPQPDAFLFIQPECGGQARISSDDYVEGAPDMVAEVASSSASYDLGVKLQVYRRNGVRE